MNLIKCCTSAHSSSDHQNLSKKKTKPAKKGGMFFLTYSLEILIDNNTHIYTHMRNRKTCAFHTLIAGMRR